MDKDEILRRLDLAPVRALIANADPQQVVYEESGWRVKDIIAHMATWETEMLRSLHAFRRGDSYIIPSYADADDYNAYAALVRMDEPIAQILDGWVATRRWLSIIVKALTPEDFAAEMTYPWGDQGRVAALFDELFAHQAQHVDDLQRALAGQAAE